MPTIIDDDVVYQLGRIVVIFIFLDQALTDLWCDLESETVERSIAVRMEFTSRGFTDKLKKLRRKIGDRIQSAPASASIIERCNEIFDRIVELAQKRNDTIHGHCFTHTKTGELHVINLGKTRTGQIRLDGRELTRFVTDSSEAALDFLNVSSEVRSVWALLGPLI
jgi:hypothetical protein